ncbi:MAG: hypothetical protein EAZ36_06280 [Verrucomicrobia bacterium]|nr:MAG: hypothetical protein EAZ36_06280 [Verrucomicrobiota bacterium]
MVSLRPSLFRRPAILGSGLFLLAALTLAPLAAPAQSRLNRPVPKYFQLTPPDQAEGAQILKQMQSVGPDGGYYLDFELRVLPRRGSEVRVPGKLWGGRNAAGPISRLSVITSARDGAGAVGSEARFLVQGGARPSAWQWPAADGAASIQVDDGALFARLAGTDLTVFDLQMPFLYWSDFIYEGKTRLNERPVNTFLLYPPSSLAKHRPDLAGIRVYLDPQYHALVRAEQIGAEERVLKSFVLGGLVKVGDHWLPKTFDLRDETTRNKTRFVVTAAALGLDFTGGVFDPGNLSGELRAPSQLTRLSE